MLDNWNQDLSSCGGNPPGRRMGQLGRSGPAVCPMRTVPLRGFLDGQGFLPIGRGATAQVCDAGRDFENLNGRITYVKSEIGTNGKFEF